MKKNILLSIMLCLGVITLWGQEIEESQFSIGPRVGVNFSNVSAFDDSESAVGLVLGVTSTYSFSETSGLTVDLLYSSEGYDLNNNEVRFAYLQIPIYYNLFFGELGQAFRPKVYAGLSPGILLSAENNDVDISEFQNSIVLSVSGGLGANYRLADRVWLNGDVRAYIGLSDVRDKDLQMGDKVAGRTVQVSLGVAFGL